MKMNLGQFLASLFVNGAKKVAYRQKGLTKIQRATYSGTQYNPGHIDWRSLERNKYAPWGRGDHSDLPILKLKPND